MKFQSLFITGTDTAVGKTTVACAVAAAVSQAGLRVGVLKPVETGCPEYDGVLEPEDARRLLYFADCRLELRTVCPYALRDPLAPLVAAAREDLVLDVDRLLRSYREIAAAHDLTLIEGAGGLLVPILPDFTFADLALRLDVPIIVVVASRLGAINHALLTVRYARSLGLRVLGYVVNFLSLEPDLAARTNLEVLADWLGPALGVVPYLGTVHQTEADRQRLAAVGRTAVRIDDLLVPV